MKPHMSVVGYRARLRAEAGAELSWAPSEDGSLIGAWLSDGKLHNCLVGVRDGLAAIHGHAEGELVGFELEPDGSAAHAWRIEVPSYSCTWPRGVRLRVLEKGKREFELADRGAGVIFLRGPLRGASEVPAPPELIAPGQEVVASDMAVDAMWIELQYEHKGTAWRQRHQYAVPAPETVVLVTAQAPEGTHEPLFKATAEIARSIVLRPEVRPSLLGRLLGRRSRGSA
jgi:hypothetical protein